MADRSTIEWTDATWNPLAAFDRVTGRRGWFCVKISGGCRNCYAASFNKFRGNGYDYTSQNLSNVRFDLVNLDQPFRWKRPRCIFVNSMTDLFGEFVSDEDIAEVFKVMYKSPRHIFQVLTKRPDRMLDWISRSSLLSNAPLENVWLGVSVEDQKTADERIPLLLETPAAVRWISAEPLLGQVNLTRIWTGQGGDNDDSSLDSLTGVHYVDAPVEPIEGSRVDWVVVGGESGPGARPLHPDWVRLIKRQCVAASVPFFFKQWGEWFPVTRDASSRVRLSGDPRWHLWPDQGDESPVSKRVGKKAAGRLLDGDEWNQYPRQSLHSVEAAA